MAAVVDVAETLSVGEVTRAFVDTVIKGIHWKDVTQVLFINSYTSHIKFVNQNLIWKMIFWQSKYSSCFELNKVYQKAHLKFGNTILMKFFWKINLFNFNLYSLQLFLVKKKLRHEKNPLKKVFLIKIFSVYYYFIFSCYKVEVHVATDVVKMPSAVLGNARVRKDTVEIRW